MIGPVRVGAAAVVVTLTEAKLHLRVDHADDDDLIGALVAAATEQVSEMTGLILGAESWQFSVPRPVSTLVLPIAPVSSVTAITYLDADLVQQSADPDGFDLFSDARRPWLQPVSGGTWPVCADRPDAITLTVSAGLAALPAALKAAILLLTGHLYQQREAVSDGQMAEVPISVRALIEPHRRGWVAA